jgi:uncharacterized RDD family membrane protein YckC
MDDRYLLDTPENVPLSFELAGLGSRFVAALLDYVFITVVDIGLLVLAFVVLSATGYDFMTAEEADMSIPAAFFIVFVMIVIAAIFFLYPLIFEIVWNGQTPGKRITGIRMVRNDGAPITALAAVIRNVIRIIDFLPMYYIVGALVMFIDSKSRRLGDLAAGTICIKERRDAVVSLDTLSQPVTSGISRSDQEEITDEDLERLRQLTPEDIRLANEFLQRRSTLARSVTSDLAGQIALRLASKMGVAVPPGEAEEFLVQVVSRTEIIAQRKAAR